MKNKVLTISIAAYNSEKYIIQEEFQNRHEQERHQDPPDLLPVKRAQRLSVAQIARDQDKQRRPKEIAAHR